MEADDEEARWRSRVKGNSGKNQIKTKRRMMKSKGRVVQYAFLSVVGLLAAAMMAFQVSEEIEGDCRGPKGAWRKT